MEKYSRADTNFSSDLTGTIGFGWQPARSQFFVMGGWNFQPRSAASFSDATSGAVGDAGRSGGAIPVADIFAKVNPSQSGDPAGFFKQGAPASVVNDVVPPVDHAGLSLLDLVTDRLQAIAALSAKARTDFAADLNRSADTDDSFPTAAANATVATGAGTTVNAVGVSPSQSAEINFLTGISSTGAVVATSFKTWNGNTPATYSAYFSTASKWGASHVAGTAGGTVTYYFDPASDWTTAEETAFRSGLELWAAVANINFVQTTTASAATLTFERGTDGEAFEDAPSQGYTVVGSTSLASQGSGVYISIDTSVYGWAQLGNFSYAGGYAVDTVLHEEGHFLGLGHGGPYNGNVTGSQQYSAYDSRLWTIMSYIELQNTTAQYYSQYTVTGTVWNGNDPTTWMPLDIVAAQQLYGMPTSTPLSGGQVFGFNTNITGDLEPFFDFTVNKNPVITLWDEGTDNTLDLSGYATPATVNLNDGDFSSFDGMTNNLAIAYNTAIDNAVGGTGNDVFYVNTDADNINGGAGTDRVVFQDPEADYTLSDNNGVVTVRLTSDGVADTLSNVETVQFSDQTVSTSTLTCFLEGTLIAAGDAQVQVERLREGDRVSVLVGGAWVMRPVVWVGHRSIRCRDLPNFTGCPVRIRAHAFATNMPLRDLLVTQDHCVFWEGRLIPARMLVNGRSIVLERGIESYTYYHVELERHGILCAEGLPAESYLDTGNRGNFANHDAVAMKPVLGVQAAHRSWADAAVPLAVERAVVEPVWRFLAQRADEMGVAATGAPGSLTMEPRLSLLTETGLCIRPVGHADGRYTFVLPAGAAGLRLMSRTARPADTLGPFIDDRRALGVRVGEIVLWQRRRRMKMMEHLRAAKLRGWFGLEDGAGRWTDGDARLLLPVQDKMTLLQIEVVKAGPYFADCDGDCDGDGGRRDRVASVN